MPTPTSFSSLHSPLGMLSKKREGKSRDSSKSNARKFQMCHRKRLHTKREKKYSHKSTFCDGNFFQSVVEWNLFSVNNKCREITAGGCVRISFRGSLQSMRAIIAPASVRRHNFSAKRADDLRRQRAKRIVVQNANLLHLLTASLSLIIYSGRSQIFPIRNGSLSAGDPSHHPEHENCLQIKSRSPSSIKAIKTTSRYQYGRQ